MKNKKNLSIVSIAFYVFAILMLAFAAYFLSSAIKYLTEYATSYGTTVSAMGKDAVQYAFNATFPYILYAVFAFGVGKIIAKLDALRLALLPEEAKVAAEVAEAGAIEVAELAEEAVEEVVEEIEAEEAKAEEAAEEVAESEEATEAETEAEEVAEEATEETKEEA